MRASNNNSRLQNMSKLEYYSVKHLPNPTPCKKLASEGNIESEIIHLTSVPLIQSQSIENHFKNHIHAEKEVKAAQKHNDSSEIQRLKAEILRLTQELHNCEVEKESLINDYQNKIERLNEDNNELHLLNTELENRYRIIEDERKRYDEELNKLKLEKMTLETLLEEWKRQVKDKDNINNQFDTVINERNFFESELKKCKLMQINLENELKEKNHIIFDYEQQINALENELNNHSQGKNDFLKQLENIAKIKEENKAYLAEVQNLKNLNQNLQVKLDKSLAEKGDNESLKTKINELEKNYKNILTQLESERMSNESLKIQLKSKTDELKLKEADEQNLRKSKYLDKQSENNENHIKIILLCAEIERLHGIIAEKIQELDFLHKNTANHIENEVHKARIQHQQEIMAMDSHAKNMANKAEEHAHKANKALEDYTKLQLYLEDVQKENALLKGKIQNLQYELESNSRTMTDRELKEINLRYIQDRANLETMIRNLKLKITEFENKNILLMIEIERLHLALANKEQECEAYTQKIILLGIEIDRLNKYNVDLKNETDKWKLSNNTLEREKETLRLQLEGDIRNKMEYESSQRYAQDKVMLENTISRLQSQLSQYELRIYEIDQLRLINNEKEKEIQSWKKKYDELEKSHQQQAIDLRIQYETVYKTQIDMEVQKALASKQVEEAGYKSQIILNKKTIEDLEAKVVLLSIELERMHNEYANKLRENENLKTHQSQFINHKGELEKKAAVERSISETQTKGLQNKIAELENHLNNMILERDRLYLQISDLKKTIDELNLKCQGLDNQHENNLNLIQIELQTKLRVEYENQMKDLTSKFVTERQQLENQIRQLRTKIDELEYDNNTLHIENQNANNDLQLKNIEINGWKEKLTNLEKIHQHEKEEMNIQFENRRKFEIDMAMRDRENKFGTDRASLEANLKSIKQKSTEYESRVMLLSTEIARLNNVCDEKNKEIETWKSKCTQLENDFTIHLEELRIQWEGQKQLEIDNMKRQITTQFSGDRSNSESQLSSMRNKQIEIEEKLRNLIVENEKLKNISEINFREIEAWRARYAQLEKQRNGDLENLRQAMEYEKRHHIEKEVKAHALRSSVQFMDNENKLNESKQRMNELEQRNKALEIELERFKLMSDERSREIDLLKQALMDAENQKQIEIDEIRIQIETLRRSTIGGDEYKIRFGAERAAYEAQIMQLKQKLSELELRLTDQMKENQRLNLLCIEKQKEIDTYCDRLLTEKGGYSYELDNLKKDLEYYRSSCSDYKDYKMKFEIERTNYENQLSQYKQMIESNKLELGKLIELTNQRKNENEILIKQNNDYKNDIQRLIKDMKNMESDFMIKMSKYEQLYRDTEEIIRSRDMYKAQLDKNNQEVAQKNQELIEKIQELDALKQKYDDALNNMGSQFLTTSRIFTRNSYVERK